MDPSDADSPSWSLIYIRNRCRAKVLVICVTCRSWMFFSVTTKSCGQNLRGSKFKHIITSATLNTCIYFIIAIFKPFIERAWQTDFQIICKTLSKMMFTIWSTHETTAHKLNQWRSWRPPQPHLVTTSGLATQHTTMIRVAWSLLQVSIVESSSPLCTEAADRIDWRDMCTFIRNDGLHCECIFLPHPLTSALPLLHRIRYCYSRATLDHMMEWTSQQESLCHRLETCVRSFAMMAYCECIFCLILWLLSCLFFIVLYQVLLYHQLEACFASSSSYCIRYCYITDWRACVRSFAMMAYCECLAPPLTSVLLLLHRSRYCYFRASLVTTWELISSEGTTYYNTLIQKVEFDRKNKRRYELFELEAKLSGRWLPKWRQRHYRQRRWVMIWARRRAAATRN
jgi:hypothetical protein